jgi:hypothetical protein
MIWAETALTALRELAQLGLSSRRIAAQLGVSKDSVRGALYRQSQAEAPPYRPTPSPEVKWPTVHECRFILDDGPWKDKRTPIWCAKTVKPGSPYCEEHHIRCYQKALR